MCEETDEKIERILKYKSGMVDKIINERNFYREILKDLGNFPYGEDGARENHLIRIARTIIEETK